MDRDGVARPGPGAGFGDRKLLAWGRFGEGGEIDSLGSLVPCCVALLRPGLRPVWSLPGPVEDIAVERISWGHLT